MAQEEGAYDLVVLGGGSAGETAAGRVAAAGRRVALVEPRLVGGECPYWGCVPSKALLIAAARRRQAARAHALGAFGEPVDVGDAEAAWRAAVNRRNDRAKHLDDAEAVGDLVAQGVEIVRGDGRVEAPGVVEVGDRSLRYENLLISLGAEPTLPPIEGLSDAKPWTSDDVLTSDELPGSLVILGGGAIGVELAQVYSTFGTRVTVVEAVDRLLALEEPEVSAHVADVLAETGVATIVGDGVERVSTTADSTTLHLASGKTVTGDRLLVATGRRPRVKGFGLESLGIDTESGAVAIGDDCRVPGHQNVFAAGDVTGKFPFTHTANYAGRVVAANVLGDNKRVNFEAVPRGVYIDPPVAGVGRTTEQARKEGVDLVRATMDIGVSARGWLEDEGGVLVLVADAERSVLVGASALGPRSDEWIAQVTLAIRAQVPIDTLVDTIQPFPAVSESLFPAYEEVARMLRGN
ncbi:MAG TPA: NAD(P)/FAD-dependent oxidoreductase [Actinomycetes bacterium]|nr:NAD(P)/FAD-dependent oxidoreductase [Actinomycetes bacterium]